ncbi:transmembrane protein, putative [Medicago truncatula]|uniref:Transmembrane protein, putative n=1 Tax=Medicago truncatula TaxID=3880 RepID=G7IJW6_MEDTR|nr:transmembrane protein, putative [Medicago truncatula]
MDVRKYGFENLRRTQSIDWRIMIFLFIPFAAIVERLNYGYNACIKQKPLEFVPYVRIHYNINEYTISVEMHRETIGLFFYNKR